MAPYSFDNIGTYVYEIIACVPLPNGEQVCNPTQFTVEVRDPCPEAVVVAAGWPDNFSAMQLLADDIDLSAVVTGVWPWYVEFDG